MNIDDYKNEYKKVRIPKMDIALSEFNNLQDFVQKIKKQDRDDEKYLLHNQIMPILIGLVILTIIMLISSVKNVLLLSGLFLSYLGLSITLILLLLDYKNISKESYDLSLLAFLKQKEERLKTWRSTPVKYQWTFTIFVSGLIMMIIGNTRIMQNFSPSQIVMSISVYLVLLLMSWLIGEHFYQKRHKKKHLPLLRIIAKQIKELSEEINNT